MSINYTDICKLVRSSNCISFIIEILIAKKPRYSLILGVPLFASWKKGVSLPSIKLIFEMLSYFEAVLFAIAISFEMSSIAQSKLYANCSFVGLKTSQKSENKSSLITLTSQLPSSRNLGCTVKADNANSILYLRGKRSNDLEKGELNPDPRDRKLSLEG